MTFSDIFKKSFLDGFTSADINIYTAGTAMLITCALALYIFVVYRVLTKKTFYSKSFNIALAGIALITSAIILTIQSSIVVSLGMVGALSIVRFRTAIKDPMDLMFLFWAIAIGIICGVGMAEIAIILSILMTVGILVLNGLPVAKAPMILVVNASELDAEEAIVAVVKQYAGSSTVKSRNMTKSSLDLIIELRTAEGSKLVREVLDIPCVCSASLMNHDGEVTF
jgi:uncharacterized membrane protein YhiD involved in acid resistance